MIKREGQVEVGAWLSGLGLDRYKQAFDDNAIDWALLPELTADDLKDIGITAVGHRRKLLAAIAELQGSSDASAHKSYTLAASPDYSLHNQHPNLTLISVSL